MNWPCLLYFPHHLPVYVILPDEYRKYPDILNVFSGSTDFMGSDDSLSCPCGRICRVGQAERKYLVYRRIECLGRENNSGGLLFPASG